MSVRLIRLKPGNTTEGPAEGQGLPASALRLVWDRLIFVLSSAYIGLLLLATASTF